MGYFISILLFMLILPLLSIGWEIKDGAGLWVLTGEWFTFWAIGCRLLVAGVRQVVQPSFTAEKIFNLKDKKSHVIIRELGFANICVGLAGILSLFLPAWRLPAAFIGGLYYGLAGAMHLTKKADSLNEKIALVSDLFLFGVSAACVVHAFL